MDGKQSTDVMWLSQSISMEYSTLTITSCVVKSKKYEM